MNARRAMSLLTGSFRRVAGARPYGAEAIISQAQEDREDRAKLNTAIDAHERGELETVSAADVKARLGL